MQIIINIVLILGMIYIIYKLFQLNKLYTAFDSIIIKFLKGVVDSRDDDNKLVEVFGKLIDKLSNGVYNLSTIQREVESLKRAAISYNQLNTLHNENINLDGRITKESVNAFKYKLTDLNSKVNKLSTSISKLDAVANRFDKLNIK